VGQTLILLTAGLLAQAGQGQVIIENPMENGQKSCGCQVPQQPQVISGPIVTTSGMFHGNYSDEVVQPEPRPSFWSRVQDRIGSIFGWPSQMPAGTVIVDGQIVNGSMVNGQIVNGQVMPANATFAEPPLSKVQPADSKVTQVEFRSSPPTVIPVPSAAPAGTGGILPKFVDKVGHQDDYSWITGQLGQVNGQWVILYATPETVDRFNGKLVLYGNVDMRSFQVGDLVNVHGGLTAQGGRLGAYQVHDINIIEKK
jgi:hypothetical protein